MKIAVTPCASCPFTTPGITRQLRTHIQNCVRHDTHFVCHKSILRAPQRGRAGRRSLDSDWTCAGYMALVYKGKIAPGQLVRIDERCRSGPDFVMPETGLPVTDVARDPATGAPLAYTTPDGTRVTLATDPTKGHDPTMTTKTKHAAAATTRPRTLTTTAAAEPSPPSRRRTTTARRTDEARLLDALGASAADVAAADDNAPERGRFVCVIPGEFVEGRGYRVGFVIEGEPGYRLTGTWPYHGKPGEVLPWFWGDDLAAAEKRAEEYNASRGITPEDAERAINASMREPLTPGRKRAASKRQAYTGILGAGGSAIGLATEDEPGYALVHDEGSFATLDAAQARADALNTQTLGLSAADAAAIVLSSIKAQNVADRRARRDRGRRA